MSWSVLAQGRIRASWARCWLRSPHSVDELIEGPSVCEALSYIAFRHAWHPVLCPVLEHLVDIVVQTPSVRSWFLPMRTLMWAAGTAEFRSRARLTTANNSGSPKRA